MPTYLKTGYFWIGLLLLVILGGLTSWLVGAQKIEEAVAYGFGAPEVISRLVSSTGGYRPKSGGWFELVRQWWAL